MKKRIISLALVVCLAAIAIMGATMAYFTDTEKATNTFTVGGVKIDLIEQQRNEDGTALEAFEQDKNLMPIVGSAQGDHDTFDMPTAKNYVDKIITVENTGVSDAYVRAYWAIPAILDDGDPTFDASANSLHFNMGDTDKWAWKTNGAWNFFATTIDGIVYNVYYADYQDVLAPEEVTARFTKGLYLDKNVDMNAEGHLVKGNVDLGDWSDGIVCPVAAVAVQAEGFATAAEALNQAFPASFNPFAE